MYILYCLLYIYTNKYIIKTLCIKKSFEAMVYCEFWKHSLILISVTKIKCDWNSDAIGRIVLSMLEIFKENPIMHKTFGAPADTQKVLFHENLRPGSLTLWIGKGNHSTFTEMEVLQMLPLRFLINIVQLA